MDFTLVAQLIRRSSNVQSGTGASLGEIERAESTLGLRFPESYRSFLSQFGWAAFGPVEVLGLGQDVPPYLDVVSVTISERSEMHPRLRHSLIPIGADGSGSYYCIDTAQTLVAESPIIYWDHEAGSDQPADKVAPDFPSWLGARITIQ